MEREAAKKKKRSQPADRTARSFNGARCEATMMRVKRGTRFLS